MEPVRGASATAAVIEVRTGDRAGCCTRSAVAAASAGLSIRSAHIGTLAGQAIDTFYVTEADGSRPPAPRAAGRRGRAWWRPPARSTVTAA